MCLLEQGYRYLVCIEDEQYNYFWSLDEICSKNEAVVLIGSGRWDTTPGLKWTYADKTRFPKFKTKKEALKFLFLMGIDITE